MEWMVERKLPTDNTEVLRIAHRAKSFRLIDGDLYRRGAEGILMCCILADQGWELLQDIHTRACGHHTAPRAIVGIAF